MSTTRKKHGLRRGVTGSKIQIMKIVVVAVGLLALVSSACSSTTKGSASGSRPPAPSHAATGSPEPASTQVTATAQIPDLEAQLLSVADLPTGWAVDNSSDPDTAAPSCLKQAKAITDTPHSVRAEFVKGTDVPTLSDSIGYYDSSDNAEHKFTAAAQVLTSCKDVSFDSDGTHVTGTVGALSFPKIGDRSAAWRFTFDAGGQSFGAIEVLIQKDKELEILGLVDIEPSVDELETLCQTAVAKLP